MALSKFLEFFETAKIRVLKNSDISGVAEIAKIVAFVEILKYLQLDEPVRIEELMVQ